MAVSDAHVFPGFLKPVLTQLLFPKPPTTFLACFYRGERQKYAGKKGGLNRGSNSQPPGHESDTLTIEPPGWGKITHIKYKTMSRHESNNFEIRLCNNHMYDSPIMHRNCMAEFVKCKKNGELLRGQNWYHTTTGLFPVVVSKVIPYEISQ